jgi:hypothetical protein
MYLTSFTALIPVTPFWVKQACGQSVILRQNQLGFSSGFLIDLFIIKKREWGEFDKGFPRTQSTELYLANKFHHTK